MKKLLNLIRLDEWWEYKLAPLLAIGYATSLFSAMPLYRVAIWLVLLLVAIITGAIYVSVVNDVTDMEEDAACGKNNRMAKLHPRYRWLVPLLCISAGILFLIFFFKDGLSRLLYLLPWVLFSLYSFPPVRLKKRGIWGVLADACGSHLFISLLIVVSVYKFTGIQINWLWFSAIAVWSFFYGLRGILWHQFTDRDNDQKVNLKTYASQVEPKSFELYSVIIFGIEAATFTLIMCILAMLPVSVFVFIYFLLVWFRYAKLKKRLVLIIAPLKLPYQIFMLDYYQCFLPISLLLYAAFTQPLAWMVLIIHILFFNNTIKKIIQDLLLYKHY